LPFHQNSGLLVAVTLEAVFFRAYTPFPESLKFVNASRKSCSVREFSTACGSASIALIVSNGCSFSRGNKKSAGVQVKRVGWVGDNSQVVCGQTFPGEIKKCDPVRCRDATANIFVGRLRGEVFTNFDAVAVKRHSSTRN
jgi:hypothetical protein